MTRMPWQVAIRSLAVQGSWNYETLTGTGFAFVILPALREIYGDGEALDAAIRRHETTFNSHPYLAPLALGAVIRMEREGEDPEVIERFKAATRGSLGTLGDQLVWAGWRPLCVLAAVIILLLGSSWWVAVGFFLVLYNIGHATLMIWGLSIGLREGRGVAERLRGPMVRSTVPRIMAGGTFLAGMAIAMIAAGLLPGGVNASPLWVTLAAGAAVVGIVAGERAREAGVLGVALLAAAGLLAGVWS